MPIIKAKQLIKRCGTCKSFKPFNGFHKRKASRDGHCDVCKECRYTYMRQYNINNPSLIRSYFVS